MLRHGTRAEREVYRVADEPGFSCYDVELVTMGIDVSSESTSNRSQYHKQSTARYENRWGFCAAVDNHFGTGSHRVVAQL